MPVRTVGGDARRVVRRPAGMSETVMLERMRAGTEAFANQLPADDRQVRAITLPMRGTPSVTTSVRWS